MHLLEGYSTQCVASAMSAPLGSRLESTPTLTYPPFTNWNRVTPPNLGDYSPTRAGGATRLHTIEFVRTVLQRHAEPLRPLRRPVCFRRISSSPAPENAAVQCVALPARSAFNAVGKEYKRQNASNDPSLQPRYTRSRTSIRFHEYCFRAR